MNLHPLEHRAGNLLALSFPALAMADKATAVLTLLVLWALVTLPRHGRELPVLWREHRLLVLAFCGFFLWATASLLLSGSGPRDIGLTLRLPVLLLTLPLLRALNIDRRYVWWGIWLGAMAAFWIAAWDRLFNGATRAGENFHFVIHFGDLATLFALLVLLGWSYWRSIPWGRLLGITATLAGLTASAWSGTRGAWLAIPFVGVYVLFSRALDFNLRARVGMLSAFAALCIAVAVGMAGGVRDGVVRAVVDARTYEPGGDIAQSSGGQRLELWRLSWRHFTDHPFAGVGAYRLQQANRALAQQGEPVPPVIHEFGHAHNQYFEVLATGGAVGFTALVALFVLPWRLFRPVAVPAAAEPGRILFSAAGRATVLAFAIFALTQSVFNHQGPLGVFGFLVIYFAVLSRSGAAIESR